MSKFPGWRTMTGVQRRNAKMEAIFERARQLGHTTLYSGPLREPVREAPAVAVQQGSTESETANG